MEIKSVTSNQNSVIKQVKALKAKKYRDEKGMFFIEGTRFVEEALKECSEIVYVLAAEKLTVSKDWDRLVGILGESDHIVYILPDKLFKEISDTENPQGIMAVIKAKHFEIKDILCETDNFLVILDSIQDPGNMGTIIRTADAAGANGIIVSKGCVDLYNSKVLRSTMGSVFHVPVYFSENLIDTIGEIKKQGIKIYAAHLSGKVNYYETVSWDNIALVIGNEANGICREVAELADMLIKIPMAGRAESLNASVAAGLLMYEVLRNRNRNTEI